MMRVIEVSTNNLDIMSRLADALSDYHIVMSINVIRKGDRLWAFDVPGRPTHELNKIDWDCILSRFADGVVFVLGVGSYTEYQFYAVKPEYDNRRARAELDRIIYELTGISASDGSIEDIRDDCPASGR